MLFSYGIGSAGEGPPSFSVRLPFLLSPGWRLNLADGGSFELLGRSCEISQEYIQYVLTVSGFDSEDEAATFLHTVCAGLIWYGLKNSTGFRFNADATPVKLYAQPKPIAEGSPIASIASERGWRESDGHYDADQTIIRPDHKKLIVFTGGSGEVRVDTPVSTLSTVMLEGISDERPKLVLSDPKLRLACEVYLSSYFESTAAASFLSRITTFEILVTDVPASASVQTIVERFIAEARAMQAGQKDSAVRSEFDSVLSRLAYLRIRSIKSRIRSLVEDTLAIDADIADAAKIAKEVSGLYDLRSTLVHSGEADKETITKGNNRLNDIVPRVLKVLFRQTASRG